MGNPGPRNTVAERENRPNDATDHYVGKSGKMSSVPDEGEYGNMNVGDFQAEHNSMELRRKTEEHIRG